MNLDSPGFLKTLVKSPDRKTLDVVVEGQLTFANTDQATDGDRVSQVFKSLMVEHRHASYVGRFMRCAAGKLPAVPLTVAAAGLITALHAFPPAAYAQSGANVAVVVNENSADSQRIGEYYARARALPASNVLRIKTSVEEMVDRATFDRTIEQPIAAAISRGRLQDRILYLVLTKGVPLRISGTFGRDGTSASVDSELTLLYRHMTGQRTALNGGIANPYFLGDRDISEARAFTHRDHDIYLVSRLDAFTVEQALALVDRASAPATEGRIVLDQRDALTNRTGEDWLELASKRLAAEGHGDQVLLETTPKPVRDVKPVLGYFSWGSTDPQNRVRTVGLGFAPGAIAANFVGTDARTLRPPPEAWVPAADLNNRSTWFAGTPESLIGDLIKDGVTGVAGQVAEPFLQGAIRPQILFPAYLSGFNLIEGFYLAMPNLSWQTIVVGDPLCAPFPRKALPPSDLKEEFDSVTELPALFSKRTVAAAVQRLPGIAERAIALSVRADVLLGRGERRDARAALNEAVQLAPGFWAALFRLATLDQADEQYDAAIDKYKRILEIQPNQAIALNNLASVLAVHQKMPAEGLPFAQRAVKLAPNEPSILETLAWIQHLLGDDASAAKLMTQVARANLNDPDVHLHSAVVFAAVGTRAAAESELAAALKLNPALEKSDDVKQLRAQLQKLTPGK